MEGNVRLRLTLSEPATLTVSLASARPPTKSRTKTVRAKAGVVTVSVRSLAKGLRAGKAKLSVSAKDAVGNTASKSLSAKR